MAESRRPRCIAPGSVSGQDLVAWSRGEAGAAVRGHLGRCAFCRGEASQFARAEAVLSAVLFRRTCPESMTIGEFALGVLDPDQMLTVAEHLLECPHCAAERRRFAAFLAEPDDLPQTAGPITRLLRRLFAQPVGDPSPVMALRGGEDESTSTYTVDGYELILSIQRSAGRAERVVAGLLLADPPPSEGTPVRLHAGEQAVQTSALDDLGNFALEGVPAGMYRLELTLSDAVIVVDALRVS